MEISVELLQKQKQIMLRILREFISVCEKHNLRYCCCGGTAIGAIRHQGIIPWDDDIDVLMPRPDYDTLLTLFPETRNRDYELITPGNRGDYYLPYAKMCASDTVLLEDAAIPCPIGVFIDIFPLDGASPRREQRLRDILGFRRQTNILKILPKSFLDNVSSAFGMLTRGNVRTFKNELLYSLNKNSFRKRTLNKIEAISGKYDYERSDIVCVYAGSYGEREFFPKKWVEEFIQVPFDGLKVNVPKYYDDYLKQIYGDYMQMPPEDKRVSHHTVAYMNLDESKNITEIKKILKEQQSNDKKVIV